MAVAGANYRRSSFYFVVLGQTFSLFFFSSNFFFGTRPKARFGTGNAMALKTSMRAVKFQKHCHQIELRTNLNLLPDNISCSSYYVYIDKYEEKKRNLP